MALGSGRVLMVPQVQELTAVSFTILAHTRAVRAVLFLLSLALFAVVEGVLSLCDQLMCVAVAMTQRRLWAAAVY